MAGGRSNTSGESRGSSSGRRPPKVVEDFLVFQRNVGVVFWTLAAFSTRSWASSPHAISGPVLKRMYSQSTMLLRKLQSPFISNLRHLGYPPDRNLEPPSRLCTGPNLISNRSLAKVFDWVFVRICLGLTHSLDPKSLSSKFLEPSRLNWQICCSTVPILAVPSTTLRVILLRQSPRTSLQCHPISAFPDSVSCNPPGTVPSTTLCVVLLR
ncbi:hypothetical protein Bca101_094360 [Brassica carinata]